MTIKRTLVLTGVAILGLSAGCTTHKEIIRDQDTSFAFFEKVDFTPKQLELKLKPEYQNLPITLTSKLPHKNGVLTLAPGDHAALSLGLPGDTVFEYITFDALPEAEAQHLAKAGIRPEMLLRSELDIYESACCPEHRIPRVHYVISNNELPTDFHADSVDDNDLLISLRDSFVIIEDKKCTVDLMMENRFLLQEEVGSDRREKLQQWIYPTTKNRAKTSNH